MMIKQLAGLVGTADLNAWETTFVRDMLDRTQEGKRTSPLSGSQVEKVEQIWRKHFAG